MLNLLRTTSIYCELERRARAHEIVAEELLSHITVALPKINRALNDIRVYFRHFTDHALSHSVRIIKNYEFLIDPTQYSGKPALSSADLFLLIGSALIHDIGMVIKESEIEALVTEEAFKSHLEEWRTNTQGDIVVDWDWCRRGVPRLAVADYVRKRHQGRSLSMILDPETSVFPVSDIGYDLVNWLGQVAAGHGMDYNDVSDPNKFPIRTSVGISSGTTDECSPRFVALCLRLGDLLDIGTARACPLLRNFSEPLPTLSMHHWNQYANSRIDRDQVNSIKITATSPSQDAERLLRDWCNWLREEGMRSVTLQNREASHYRIALGKIEYQISPKNNSLGRPIYEFSELKFNLDERVVFERLFGKALYGRPELAFRELIQNAVDAQRTKLVHELSSGSDWKTLSENDRQARLNRELTSNCERMPITVLIEERPSSTDKNKELWITITDCGIGMTRDVLEHYFLKVGRSRWGEDPSITRMGIGNYTIGTFGIGVLAALMIADRISVTTRSCLPDEKGIKATIYGWQGYLGTEEVTDAPTGTSISLRMHDSQYRDLNIVHSTFRHLAPNIDFKIIIKSSINSLERSINPIRWDVLNHNRRKNVQPTDRVAQVALDSDGSIALLSQARSLREGVILCQDGINIDQVPYPSGHNPEEILIRHYKILADLRGTGRVPLELSRNLPEEGHQRFWSKYVTKIWDSIARAFPGDYVINRALADLVDYELLSMNHHPLRFIIPKIGLLRNLPKPTEISRIHILNPLDENKRVEAIMSEAKMVWLTPGLDLHYTTDLEHTFDTETPDLPSYWSRAIKPPRRQTEDFDLDESDDGTEIEYDDAYYHVSELDANVSEKKLYFTQRLDLEWKEMLKRYPFLIQGTVSGSKVILTSQASDNSIAVARVIGFQISENWLSLREPSRGHFHLVPVPLEAEFRGYARRNGLSLAGFYASLMWLNFRTLPTEWGAFSSGDIGAKLDAIGSELETVTTEGLFSEPEPEETDEEIDMSMGDSDDEPRSYAEATLADFRRVVDKLAESSATQALEPYVLSWERDSW